MRESSAFERPEDNVYVIPEGSFTEDELREAHPDHRAKPQTFH